MLAALLTLLTIWGLGHFWPAPLEEVTLKSGDIVIGQSVRETTLPKGAGSERLYFTGNQDITGSNWQWIAIDEISQQAEPTDLIRLTRTPWGDFIGRLMTLESGDQRLTEQSCLGLHPGCACLARQPAAPWHVSASHRRWSNTSPAAGKCYLLSITKCYVMGTKTIAWGQRIWQFLSEGPRTANTGGGVWPAIFGTVLMVILMSVIVTPFGVLAAIYLNEIAHQNRLTRLVRIGVRNLAGVPSIVYGVFGLGVFVYGVGGSIDSWFFSDELPSPTFGTGGLLWASLTLALLTLPVVIVATEEGLARIPDAQREGAVALGATRLEMLTRVVLPMATPAMLTGMILAVARAAGEVAPLMLVGVAKLAPQMPVDGEFPYLHLERKFMHLGYHLFDTAFHGEDVQAAIPLVFATALLLVLIVLVLNLTAIFLRHYLRRQRGNEC